MEKKWWLFSFLMLILIASATLIYFGATYKPIKHLPDGLVVINSKSLEPKQASGTSTGGVSGSTEGDGTTGQTAVCGDGICASGESSATCRADCPDTTGQQGDSNSDDTSTTDGTDDQAGTTSDDTGESQTNSQSAQASESSSSGPVIENSPSTEENTPEKTVQSTDEKNAIKKANAPQYVTTCNVYHECNVVVLESVAKESDLYVCSVNEDCLNPQREIQPSYSPLPSYTNPIVEIFRKMFGFR